MVGVGVLDIKKPSEWQRLKKAHLESLGASKLLSTSRYKELLREALKRRYPNEPWNDDLFSDKKLAQRRVTESPPEPSR